MFTLRKGFWRGMHYHEKKEETFYVDAARMRAVFIDIDTEERVEHVLTKGATAPRGAALLAHLLWNRGGNCCRI